uniref:Ser/Thr protein phosphatase n=1 Tax=Cryptococcus bacillisporus CA1280 TaxID=1296109 RepID=A0A0D0VE45_CRYGA|nr:Ser/Thr protein phosphatase [Cryptococcus bacillisporus CA1280]
MSKLAVLAAVLGLVRSTTAEQITLGPTAYTASGAFPTSFFSEYYNDPTQTMSQVQPKISDSVLNKTYLPGLTGPNTIPTNDTADPLYYPPIRLHGSAASNLYQNVTDQIKNIVAGDTSSNCSKCINSLTVASSLAKEAPELVPHLLVSLCNYYGFASEAGCNVYTAKAQGPFYAQVLEYAVSGYDGQYLCQNFINKSECKRPPLDFWTKPKPINAKPPVPKGTDRIKVLHMSDFHIDPRHATGSEGNCTSGLCCRRGNPVESLNSNYTASVPVPRYGYFLCDTPGALGAAAVEAIPVLTGTDENDAFNMTIFTGDMVSHDPYYELSRDYIEYTETTLYNLWKQTLNPTSPLYAAIGNHDSYQQAFDPPLPFPINLGNNRVGTMSILQDCGKARDGLMGKLLKRLRPTMALTLFNMRQTSRSLPSTLISGTAPTSLLTSTLLILITLASSNF